jgi:hypothetical protein
MERGARYFSQPDCGADDYVDAPGWGYLEGGDVFVLGRRELVGHSGGCSNPEGGECHELCVWPLAHAGFSHGHALKRSANMISN